MEVLFESDSKLKGLTFDRGFIEHETALPFSSSGPRCHDLFLRGVLTDGAPVAVSIEAKADEPFDTTVGDKVRALAQKKSNFPSRLEWLAHYLFGESAFLDFEKRVLKLNYASMPYQLLSAFGGVCVEAQTQKASHAVLIIHEFRTDLTDDTKMAYNSVALEDFFLWKKNGLAREAGLYHSLEGPLKTREGEFCAVKFPSSLQLWVGKIVTNLRTID